MFLKKCAYCQKEIPSRAKECPYCRRDESGRDMAAAERAAQPLDAQAQSEIRALSHDDPVIRKEASDRLSQRGAAVVPVLINIVQEHTHQGAKEAVRLLGRLRDRRAVGALIRALQVGDEDLRGAAVQAL